MNCVVFAGFEEWLGVMSVFFCAFKPGAEVQDGAKRSIANEGMLGTTQFHLLAEVQ